MKLTVLMPMGGLGQRFVDAGFDTPKPMIDVEGLPMFLRALESLPSFWDIEYVFVIREDQNERYDLKRLIEEACPGARMAVLDHDTRGPVETCLQAAHLLDPSLPVIVADCDIRFSSDEYEQKIARSEVYDGLLVGFDSTNPRYSFAELDDAGNVTRTAEKVAISSHALLGGYYFRSGELFLDLAQEFIASGLQDGLKEFYLSHLFNMLLKRGGQIGFAEADVFDIWGTPEELAAYLERSDRKESDDAA